MLRVGLPLIASLGWGLCLLFLFPQVAYPLVPTMLIVPDLGYLVVASGLVALAWAIARTVLVYFALRHRDPPKSRRPQLVPTAPTTVVEASRPE